MRIRRHSSSPTVSVRELEYQISTPDSTPDNILEEIVWQKEKEVTQFRETLSLQDLQKKVVQSGPALNFLAGLRSNKTQPALIAEVKKASPSQGLFRENFQPVEIAKAYELAGASCLSVLTDEKFFQGSFQVLEAVREAVQIPLLCKDFIIYPYQVFKARAHGADAVLLIAAVLTDQDLIYFLKIIKTLGMTALIEVHTLSELDRALNIPGVELVGINNRNLETFTVDLATTEALMAERIQQIGDRNLLIVSESGIHERSDLQRVQNAGVDAILVGESLIRDREAHPNFSTEMERMDYKISELFKS
jgi:indole-3-glycerol phosphate synthase